MEHAALNHFLLLLCLSVPTVWMLRHFHMPPLLGYLAVGILAGPHAANWIPADAALDTLAEIGLVFLLFTVGLEFSIPRLLAMGKTVFGLGFSQVLITTLLGGAVAWCSGIDWQAALVVGGILALSSTAIVARQLGEQLELHTRHGQLSIGVLLFQDLAVIPLLVVIPILATGGPLTLAITIAFAKGLLAFLLMYLVGHYLLQPFFQHVANTHSAELFTLATLSVALAAAWLTHQLDLSLALGAFLAGLTLSETEYRRQIEIDIRPFRDVLMGLFFISVGTQFNLSTIYSDFFWVASLTAVLVLGKAAATAILTRLHGYDATVALHTGFILGQGGEFGFAILVVALQNHILTAAESQPVIAAIVTSMLIAPVLIRFHYPLSILILRRRGNTANHAQNLYSHCMKLHHHVVICGFGRIGQNLALFLRDNSIEYVGLDLNQKLIGEAREAGETVFHGDSTHRKTLLHAGLRRARALVITFDNEGVAKRIIRNSKSIHGELPIIVRSQHDHNMRRLLDVGATNVVPESFESSMMLAEQVLEQLGVAREQAMSLMETARQDEYRRIKAVFHGEIENHPLDTHAVMLRSVIIPANSFSDGKTLGVLALDRYQVNVTALRREQQKIDRPPLDTTLQEGDTVVIQGTMRQTQQAERHLLNGPRR